LSFSIILPKRTQRSGTAPRRWYSWPSRSTADNDRQPPTPVGACGVHDREERLPLPPLPLLVRLEFSVCVVVSVVDTVTIVGGGDRAIVVFPLAVNVGVGVGVVVPVAIVGVIVGVVVSFAVSFAIVGGVAIIDCWGR
jgi:hypothetical protein